MEPLTQDQITAAVLNGGIKVKLQPKWNSWEGTFSAPFDERTDYHPVYGVYTPAMAAFRPLGGSKINALAVPCGVTFITPSGHIHITETNQIETLDIRLGDGLDIERGDGSPPEVIAAKTTAAEAIAAEMIKNIYLATYAPEYLPESWRAEQ